MPIDASIYSNVQQPASLLDQYSKLAQLKALGVTSRLHELQGQAAEQSLAEQQAVRQAGIDSGGDTSRLPGLLFGAGAVKPGMEAQAANIKAAQERAGTEHTQAQTRDITARHIAGAWSALAKYNGSDEGVRATHDLMAPVVGEQAAQTVTDKLLAMPPEKRLAYSVAQAATNPVGQEALKLYFPETKTSTVGIGPGGTQVTTASSSRPGLSRPGQAPAAPAQNATGLQGDDFLKTLPKNMADQIKALADGRMAFPGGMALKTPYWQNMVTMVSQYDPNFDQINYNTRAATRKAFTSGAESKSLNALNTVMGHLDEFDKAAAALNNTGFTLWNQAANTIGGKVNPELKARLNRFDLTKQAVVDEMEKAYRGSGGSQAGIDAWKKTVDNSDSYQALQASMQQGVRLLESKIGALGDQYNKGMGTSASGLELLNPKARATFERLAGGGSRTRGSVNAAPAVSPNVQQLLDKYAPMQGTRG